MHLTEVFAALGDQTRLTIVERLINEGELTAGSLQIGMTISPPAVSRHLKVLRNAGLIAQRADAQKRYYSVRSEAVDLVLEWITRSRDTLA